MLKPKIIKNRIHEWVDKLDSLANPHSLSPMDILEIRDLLLHCGRCLQDIPNDDYDQQDEIKKQAKVVIEEKMKQLGLKK